MQPLQAGDSAPFFFLKTPYDVEVALAKRLLEGTVALEFVRGSWDPDTRERLDQLAGARETVERLEARLLVVACERSETLAGYLDKHPSPLTLLVDSTREVSRSYGILRRFSFPVPNIARPSTFVIDRCGFVRYAYVSRLSIHAAPLEEIYQALRELQNASGRGEDVSRRDAETQRRNGDGDGDGDGDGEQRRGS